jgi:hypothetical protein
VSANGLACGDVMTLGKIFGILIFSSLVATGPTLAGDISKNLVKSKNLANSKRVANVTVVIHHAGPETPIVMGRSIGLHHKTKLHHLKVKPLDSNENSSFVDGSQ